MTKFAVKISAALFACLGLAGCLTVREHALAPASAGLVIDAATGKPVMDALVRYADLKDAPTQRTGPDGAFTLEGRSDLRPMVILPVSGIVRVAATVQVSAQGMSEGYASAFFLTGLTPARTREKVIVLMFPSDAAETPLQTEMRDCVRSPEQAHALRLAAYAAGLDPKSPPPWLDHDSAEALYEHAWRALPVSVFRACGQTTTAYELFRTQTEKLQEVARSRADHGTP